MENFKEVIIMSELKKHYTGADCGKELEDQIMLEIRSIDETISKLQLERKQLRKKLLELRIAPFKLGGYALVEVPSGRNYKEQKCLLDISDFGELQVIPIKANGKLSSRHFNVYPHMELGYHFYLKEVTE